MKVVEERKGEDRKEDRQLLNVTNTDQTAFNENQNVEEDDSNAPEDDSNDSEEREEADGPDGPDDRHEEEEEAVLNFESFDELAVGEEANVGSAIQIKLNFNDQNNEIQITSGQSRNLFQLAGKSIKIVKTNLECK